MPSLSLTFVLPSWYVFSHCMSITPLPGRSRQIYFIRIVAGASYYLNNLKGLTRVVDTYIAWNIS